MSKSIYSIQPDPEILLALEPEEFAGILLEHLNSLEKNNFNRYNMSLPHNVVSYPGKYQIKLSEALMEAWVWLEKEGLIAPKPQQDEGWFFVTRRGQRLKNSKDLQAYQKGNLLPKKFLHPLIAQKVWSDFIRGEYGAAVLIAFKEIEVAVRKAGGFTLDDIGIKLIRKAFHEEKRPLTDTNLPIPERQALANLFAGAIGLYKNPHSHRDVDIKAEEAAEMIILASHLLKIVDLRLLKTTN